MTEEEIRTALLELEEQSAKASPRNPNAVFLSSRGAAGVIESNTYTRLLEVPIFKLHSNRI